MGASYLTKRYPNSNGSGIIGDNTILNSRPQRVLFRMNYEDLNAPTTVWVPSTPSGRVTISPHQFEQRYAVTFLPKVVVVRKVFNEMCSIVSSASTEVGWLGAVEVNGDQFTIKEIFVPNQTAHGTTCEITPQGLSDLAMELLKRPNGDQVFNSIRFWGHVHPSNDTNPSGQDNDQMRIFEESCGDFFLRGILGRYGRMEFTLFHYERGIISYDIPWSIEEDGSPIITDSTTSQVMNIAEKVEVIKTEEPSSTPVQVVEEGNRTTEVFPRNGEIGEGEVENFSYSKTRAELQAVLDELNRTRGNVELASERKSKAQGTFNFCVYRAEESMARRILKWAWGIILPPENQKDPSDCSRAELELRVQNGSADPEDLNVYENVNLIPYFLAELHGEQLVDQDSVGGYYETQFALDRLEDVALGIGRKQTTSWEITLDFYSTLITILEKRGHANLLEMAYRGNWIPGHVISYLSSHPRESLVEVMQEPPRSQENVQPVSVRGEDFTSQYKCYAVMVEYLVSTRLIEWANGICLPDGTQLSWVSDADLKRMMEVTNLRSAATAEYNIRQACKRLAECRQGRFVEPEVIDSHLATWKALLDLERPAIRIGRGEVTDLETVGYFFSKIVRIMMSRGMKYNVKDLISDGLLKEKFLEPYEERVDSP